ncbi:calcium homeostasis modulator protein 6 [Serinus canaria]|uniref:calcium homeostasis modulator protein 6 n=1 Tax=Serinus canaria TaxID=9135 RepID=UPI0021CCC51D|nr:calcium homeostasis modulator protein 6 [Serinus canaria]
MGNQVLARSVCVTEKEQFETSGSRTLKNASCPCFTGKYSEGEQLIGWFLIASIMTVALISTCVSHCCSPVSYLQLKFWKFYSKKEREVFEKKANEHATKLAERNTNCFFEAIDPAPFHTPSNTDWQKISIFHTFNSQEQYYSTIHKYVNTNRGNDTEFEEEGQDLNCFSICG